MVSATIRKTMDSARSKDTSLKLTTAFEAVVVFCMECLLLSFREWRHAVRPDHPEKRAFLYRGLFAMHRNAFIQGPGLCRQNSMYEPTLNDLRAFQINQRVGSRTF